MRPASLRARGRLGAGRKVWSVLWRLQEVLRCFQGGHGRLQVVWKACWNGFGRNGGERGENKSGKANAKANMRKLRGSKSENQSPLAHAEAGGFLTSQKYISTEFLTLTLGRNIFAFQAFFNISYSCLW